MVTPSVFIDTCPDWLLAIFCLTDITSIYFFTRTILKNPGLATFSENVNKKYSEEEIKKWYCKHCEIMTWEGVFHCDYCGVCIEEHDHHCPWVGKCIGRGNLNDFWCWIACLALTLALFIFIIVNADQ